MTNISETIPETPVLSRAKAIGNIPAMRTMLSQLMVLYAASTFRKAPEITINNEAIRIAISGEIGIKSNIIAITIAIIIIPAMGAL